MPIRRCANALLRVRRQKCGVSPTLKKLDGTRNVHTGSFAVTVARFVCFDDSRA
jgi:hypothetical protein